MLFGKKKEKKPVGLPSESGADGFVSNHGDSTGIAATMQTNQGAPQQSAPQGEKLKNSAFAGSLKPTVHTLDFGLGGSQQAQSSGMTLHQMILRSSLS